MTHQDRRRYPRLTTPLDVTVDAAGFRWQAKAVGLSVSGVKVVSPAMPIGLPRATTVQLAFSLTGQPTMCAAPSVVRTDRDGLALEFSALEDQQRRQFEHAVNSLLLREWEALLNDFRPKRSHESSASVPNKPSMTPKLMQDTLTVESRIGANEPSTLTPELEEHVESAISSERSTSVGKVRSEDDRWSELFSAAGLDGLRLPSDSVLTRAWQDFLKNFQNDEPNEKTAQRSKR